MADNVLYYGDNLDVLGRYVKDESVDLVYLDPPFNSNADYNVLFGEQDGKRSAAQVRAFEDTWHWDEAAGASFHAMLETPGRVRDAIYALHVILGPSDMMAYLVMMAPRLVELRRVLKPTGSLYLHCDPSASHYLKVLLDAVFGPQHFRNEVVWKRTHSHGASKRYGPVADSILFYTKGDEYVWTDPRAEHDPGYIESHFRHSDDDGRLYQPITLTGAGVTRHGDSGKPWRGFDPTTAGRHWALPGTVLSDLGITEGTVQEKLDALDAAGMIYWPEKQGGQPRLKQFLDRAAGPALGSIWTDIAPLNSQAQERLGYPTQKPVALLDRIILASSNEGDTVLDPFCGCGTTIAAAQRLKRRWIGIDVTHLAITLIKQRLRDTFPDAAYNVIGEPADLAGAAALAEQDPYQFQWWALGLVGARPTEQKKGADKGIDGRLYFRDPPDGPAVRQIVLSVKAGHTGAAHVRDLRGVMEREKAEIGVLLTMQDSTQPMRTEAASAGFYHSEAWNKTYPRVQILTIAELLAGKRIEYPPSQYVNVTFKKAPKAKPEAPKNPGLGF